MAESFSDKRIRDTYINGPTDSGDNSSCEIQTGDDRHLLVPFLHCLSHSLSIFLVFPSSNSDSEILRKTNTCKIESLLLVGEFG